jgi:hypothetical protein
MMTFGLDYSSGRPSHTAMKTAGVTFVCRYIGSQVRKASRDAKWLSPSEAASLHLDGFAIVAVFETTAKRAEAGHAAGVTDAHTAIAELAYCGLPADLPVYFAVDYDDVVGPNIRGYFDGIKSVLPLSRIGAYGGYKVIHALFEEERITYGWQTYAWSDGKWDSRNHIEQYSNNHTIGSAGVDYDRAMKEKYGQWPATGAPPAPSVKPWPGRYLEVKSPLMHGSDVTWVQQRLNAHGAKLKVDGEYGKLTAAAVRAFQKAKKLTADSIVGAKTWNALAK